MHFTETYLHLCRSQSRSQTQSQTRLPDSSFEDRCSRGYIWRVARTEGTRNVLCNVFHRFPSPSAFFASRRCILAATEQPWKASPRCSATALLQTTITPTLRYRKMRVAFLHSLMGAALLLVADAAGSLFSAELSRLLIYDHASLNYGKIAFVRYWRNVVIVLERGKSRLRIRER